MNLVNASAATDTQRLLGSWVALSGGVNIDLDRSVLFQMFIFTFLILVLKPLLFDPVLKVIALREERTEGAKATARTIQERAGELLRRYEKELERVQQVATEEREKVRTETAKLESEILREAREATSKIIEDGRRRIESQVNTMRFELGRESERVAQQIAGRVLGRDIQG